MAKRLAIAFFVVLGVCVLLVSGFLLVLFLAPGFSIFGIKYIAKDTHILVYEDTRVVDVSSVGGQFDGSITINTNEVPVEICFSATGSASNAIRFTYVDNFNGITNSKFDDPSLEIKKENGGVVFITHEFQKLIYESSTSNRLLKIYLPSRYAAESANNLIINAGKANVSFYFENDNAKVFTPNFDRVEINTTGKININSKITADTYAQTSNGSIEIAAGETNNINATNYALVSKNGKINVKRNIDGYLLAETKNGEINLMACKNLIATTEDGNITASGDISGLVKINAKGGNVSLGKVLGEVPDGDIISNTVSTSSGNVVIERLYNGEISTHRGSVSIKNSNDLKVSTNMGKVVVEEAISAISVETVRGNVTLGGQGMTLNNPKVFTRLGKVEILSANGTADIQTISSNINFDNSTCDEIKINCGGKLTASNLLGNVEINSQKNIDIAFGQIRNGDNIVITLGDTATFAKITATNNTARDTRYILTGKTVTRFEKNANGTFSKVDNGSDLSNTNEPTVVGGLIKVTGSSNTDVEIYFNS